VTAMKWLTEPSTPFTGDASLDYTHGRDVGGSPEPPGQ
jgi:hypothetical protein